VSFGGCFSKRCLLKENTCLYPTQKSAPPAAVSIPHLYAGICKALAAWLLALAAKLAAVKVMVKADAFDFGGVVTPLPSELCTHTQMGTPAVLGVAAVADDANNDEECMLLPLLLLATLGAARRVAGIVGTRPSIRHPKLLLVVAWLLVNQCSISRQAAAATGGVSKKIS